MKLIHSLRFQFTLSFSLFIGAIMGITSILAVRQLTSEVERTFTQNGIATVEKAVSLIDGDAFEALAKSQDVNDPFYTETLTQLILLQDFSNCLYLSTLAPASGDTWQFIIDASDDPDVIGTTEDISTYDDAFKRTLQSGKTEVGTLENQGKWGWLISIYAPIKNSSGKIVGMAACDFDGGHLHDSIEANKKRELIIRSVSILLGFALLAFFLKRIFAPLRKINTILKEISRGEGDLTTHITTVRADDEIGELALYFNMTLEKIKNLIILIKEEAVSLSGIGGELSGRMGETAVTVEQIHGSIQSIQGRVINQSAGVTQTHNTMMQITVSIDKLNRNVEKQSDSVSRSSSAVEEMLANIRSVADTLVKNTENVNNLTQASEAGRSGLQEVATDIQEIARESEGLLEINAVMENIASQTNLLSMNAAIEAAHAGEAGKGFAVVADEIRKLAESSSEQSKTISVVLKKIKESVDKISRSAGNVLNKFEAIDAGVRTVAEQEENIRGAMESQGRGSQQILEAIGSLNEITRQVKDGSVVMLDGSREIISESKNLETATQEISGGMNEIASGAGNINAAIKSVNEISDKNRSSIDRLVREVSRFKVE